jgi:hypothetical protein
MTRILLALVLSLSCTAAFAGIPSVTDVNHINCPKSGKLDSVPASLPAAPVVSPAPAKGSGALAVDHGSAVPAHGAAPRIISPRWHSFLPGMFR